MEKNRKGEIKLFEEKKVRALWDEEQEKWYVAIVDVVAALSESLNPQVYWRVLKKRLKSEGNETVTNCNALKMLAPDGKMRLTDVADTEQIFRLIQSIPSPKAEPFKLWLAQLGKERLDEMQDPELTIDRALQQYLSLGYSENWINQRLKSIEIRKELTDEWKRRGVERGYPVCNPTGYHHQGLVGQNHERIHKTQRPKRGKPPRQHDQYRVDPQYAR